MALGVVAVGEVVRSLGCPPTQANAPGGPGRGPPPPRDGDGLVPRPHPSPDRAQATTRATSSGSRAPRGRSRGGGVQVQGPVQAVPQVRDDLDPGPGICGPAGRRRVLVDRSARCRPRPGVTSGTPGGSASRQPRTTPTGAPGAGSAASRAGAARSTRARTGRPGPGPPRAHPGVAEPARQGRRATGGARPARSAAASGSRPRCHRRAQGVGSGTDTPVPADDRQLIARRPGASRGATRGPDARHQRTAWTTTTTCGDRGSHRRTRSVSTALRGRCRDLGGGGPRTWAASVVASRRRRPRRPPAGGRTSGHGSRVGWARPRRHPPPRPARPSRRCRR